LRTVAKGFTLIELLIVVAIIAILAAIAVPNFLEAQTRSKVARCLADMRSIATGAETYTVDYNKAPAASQFSGNSTRVLWGGTNINGIPVGSITSPISYMTSIPKDPFASFISSTVQAKPGEAPFGYDKAGFGLTSSGTFPNGPFSNFTTSDATGMGFVLQLPVDYAAGLQANGAVTVQTRNPDQAAFRWVLWSIGPSNALPPARPGDSARSRFVVDGRYDPTHGTVSSGYVLRYANGPQFPGQ